MSYRCAICDTPSTPGQPRRVHVVSRQVTRRDGQGLRQEIEKELPICSTCERELQDITLDELRLQVAEGRARLLASAPRVESVTATALAIGGQDVTASDNLWGQSLASLDGLKTSQPVEVKTTKRSIAPKKNGDARRQRSRGKNKPKRMPK